VKVKNAAPERSEGGPESNFASLSDSRFENQIE